MIGILMQLWAWFVSLFVKPVPDSARDFFEELRCNDNLALRLGGLKAGGNAHQRRIARRRFLRELKSKSALSLPPFNAERFERKP